MKLSRSWLKQPRSSDGLVFDEDDQIISDTLTRLGLEVEGLSNRARGLEAFTVGKIISAVPHPQADRLRLCRVETNQGMQQVVCGAPNARDGLTIAYAPAGAVIPRTGAVLKPAVIRGVESNGMCCSVWELMLGEDHDGIIELPENLAVGMPLAEALNLADTVFEIAITPNRADCFGVAGIRRDLRAAGLGRQNLIAETVTKPFKAAGASSIALRRDENAASGCMHFVGRMVRGVRNRPSPDWLVKLLLSVGMKPISALVDITNYLLYEMNRPLHVFDAAKISGAITVRLAKNGESVRALNGKDYQIPQDTIVIADDAGVLSIGGIMGGEASGVTDETKDVFIEAAYFLPSAIARAGRSLNLHSESRARFERGIDPMSCAAGVDAATRLIIEICGGEASEIVEVGNPPIAQSLRKIAFRPSRVASLGGVAVAIETQAKILHGLGFQIPVKQPDEQWQVTVPSWRGDCVGEADLVEEILRVYGYHHIPATPLPPWQGAAPQQLISFAEQRLQRARRWFALHGYSDCITWAFVSASDAKKFANTTVAIGDAAAAAGAATVESLKLLNPISSELDTMRPSPLPNLLKAAQSNFARGEVATAQFEIGAGYFSNDWSGQKSLAVALRVGQHDHWLATKSSSESTKQFLFAAKSEILALLESLNVALESLAFTSDAPPWYHPGQSAQVRMGPKIILGQFGILHPSVCAEYDLPLNATLIEIDFDSIPLPKEKKGGRGSVKARSKLVLSPLQKLRRDFAFLVDQSVPAEKILRAARTAEKSLIESVELFDLYQGQGLPEGKKSLALRVTLQPLDDTLLDSEIERISAAIIKAVETASGAKLRS